jgi:hypothetical protein
VFSFLLGSFLDIVAVFVGLLIATPAIFTTIVLLESASYRDAILHPEWQYTMAKEILLLLSGLAHGTVCLVPHMFIRSLVSVSIRLRPTMTILLSAIRLIFFSIVFNKNMVVIMMRLLLRLPI